jgi:predicted MFS family arabinose efflux permease
MSQSVPPRLHPAWAVLAVVMLVMMAASGLRSAFGVYIKPIEGEMGWDRAALSGAAAVGLLVNGALSPFMGWLADRWSARLVLLASSALMALGAGLAGQATSLLQLYASVGLLIPAAAAGCSIPTASALATRWFVARRGLVMGLLGAGMSAGQLIVIPLAAWLAVTAGWRLSYLALGAGILVASAVLVSWLVHDDPARRGLAAVGASRAPAPGSPAPPAERRVSVAEAMGVPTFWLLASTYFVCGYTSVGLVLTHLAPHAAEHGFTEMNAAQALGIMGAMNVVGTLASGWLCDRFGRKAPLASYYALRGLSLIFLLFVRDLPTLHVFAAVFGLNFISTVPATTAITANVFGRLSVGTLSGFILFAHQAGAALGAAAGGWLFTAFGSYTWAFVSAALLAFVAAGLVLLMRDEPLDDRRAPARPAPPGVLPLPTA